MTKRDRLELVREMVELSAAAGDPVSEILAEVGDALRSTKHIDPDDRVCLVERWSDN